MFFSSQWLNQKPKLIPRSRNRCTWASCTKDSNLGRFSWMYPGPNVPLRLRAFQQTPGEYPNPQPTVYEEIPFISGFGDVWRMLQGYVGVPLDYGKSLLESPIDSSWVFMFFSSPRILREHNKYHGYTVRGTPNCPLTFGVTWCQVSR